ncbi:ATP-binding protein [Pseudonocardia sp. RS010]|uniref:ATP-binding protein n=1 Tax=Pseudonocardia sp. RS010 TaxID=3385979 RepID=UPI0039A3D6B9
MRTRRDGSEGNTEPSSGAAPARVAPTGTWRRRLPAVLETLGLVRSGLRRWLAQLGWPEDAALDVLLAVNEAVSNAVEHGFPPAGSPDGVVDVAAEVEWIGGDRRLRLRIRDNGCWLPRPGPEVEVNRRRGLPMMSALMDEVRIHRGGPEPGDGTEVVLLGPRVPAP